MYQRRLEMSILWETVLFREGLGELGAPAKGKLQRGAHKTVKAMFWPHLEHFESLNPFQLSPSCSAAALLTDKEVPWPWDGFRS